ncbi:MAG: PspA/IM30 family protein [Kurthia sp.]|nr:PspA/IM30 family protein [Candidatus Kurthia equi]
MGLLQRLKYSIEADLNHFFDKKEEKNPIMMLNQYIREAEKQTEQTGKFLERQEQLKIKLQKELQQAKEMYATREKQVGLATASGEQDLVDFATQEMTTYAQRIEALEGSITQVDKELFELERKFEEMKHKIKDMKVRQLQLMGKENVIRANTQMNRILNPESTENANKRLDTFESMENYIERLGQKIDQEHETTSMEQRLANLEKKQPTENSF